MVSQDLLNVVQYHYSQGENPDKIFDILVSEGWQQEAVEEALDTLPKPPSFWQQLPTYPYFQALDARTANLPPRIIISVSVGLIILVIVIGIIISNLVGPGIYTGDSRDQEREDVYAKLKIALERYHDKYYRYPDSINELLPNYINYIPLDPKSNKPYGYTVQEGGKSYLLCIIYETKSQSEGCVNYEVK